MAHPQPLWQPGPVSDHPDNKKLLANAQSNPAFFLFEAIHSPCPVTPWPCHKSLSRSCVAPLGAVRCPQIVSPSSLKV